jgi:hypothetical protein
MATLSDYGLTVTEAMTTPSKPGKAARPVWNVTGTTAGYEDALYALGAKKWRGAFSFWHDPTEELLEAIAHYGKTTFADRVDSAKARSAKRTDRYRTYSENASARSEAAHDRFRAILDPIPFGQPILVGHYSERKHRRTLEKADNALRSAVEEADKAKYYRGRALSSSFKAEDKDVAFMHRRLKEAEAERRVCQRHLDRVSNPEYNPSIAPSIHPQWGDEKRQAAILRYTNLVAEYQEKADYWRQQIEAAGAGTITKGISEADAWKKAAIKKGDYIMSDRHFYQVLRVNAQSVTGQCLTPNLSDYKPRIPYAEIEQHITAEQYAAKYPPTTQKKELRS